MGKLKALSAILLFFLATACSTKTAKETTFTEQSWETTISVDTTVISEETTTTTVPTVQAKTPTIDTWDRLAQCECAGNWACNTGNGFSGGLQFSHEMTWVPYGGQEFAPMAWQATKEQQIVIATRIWEKSGWWPWPGCAAKFGWL